MVAKFIFISHFSHIKFALILESKNTEKYS